MNNTPPTAAPTRTHTHTLHSSTNQASMDDDDLLNSDIFGRCESLCCCACIPPPPPPPRSIHPLTPSAPTPPTPHHQHSITKPKAGAAAASSSSGSAAAFNPAAIFAPTMKPSGGAKAAKGGGAGKPKEMGLDSLDALLRNAKKREKEVEAVKRNAYQGLGGEVGEEEVEDGELEALEALVKGVCHWVFVLGLGGLKCVCGEAWWVLLWHGLWRLTLPPTDSINPPTSYRQTSGGADEQSEDGSRGGKGRGKGKGKQRQIFDDEEDEEEEEGAGAGGGKRGSGCGMEKEEVGDWMGLASCFRLTVRVGVGGCGW